MIQENTSDHSENNTTELPHCFWKERCSPLGAHRSGMVGYAKAHTLDKLSVLIVSSVKGRSMQRVLTSLRACSSSMVPGASGRALAAAGPRCWPEGTCGSALCSLADAVQCL